MNKLNGEEKTTIVFTLMGMVFLAPFLIIMIINPLGFGKNETWSLIILGMATASLPVSVFGFSKIIIILGSEQQFPNEVKQE